MCMLRIQKIRYALEEFDDSSSPDNIVQLEITYNLNGRIVT